MSLHVQARVSGNPRQRKQWKVQLHKVELLVSVSKGKRAGAAWGFSFFSVKSHVCDALRRFCCFINAAQTGGGNLSHLPLHSGNNYPFGDVSKPAGFPRKAAGKTTSLMNLTHLRTAAKFRSLQSLQLFARHHGLLSNFWSMCYKLVLWFSIFWSVTLFDVKEPAATSGQWHHTLRSVCEDRLRIWQTRRSSGQVLRKSLKVYTIKHPRRLTVRPPTKMMGLEDDPCLLGWYIFRGELLNFRWVIPRNSFIWILETLSKVGFGLPFK